MKTLRNTALLAILLFAGTFTACKKGDETAPAEQEQLKNSAQLFMNDNSSIALEGNDVVNATYVDKTLKITFSQNGTDVTLQIPNYDIAASQSIYNNSSATFNLARGQKNYNSASIFIPVIVFNPTRPVFVTDKQITITANNLKVDANTTDISINIQSGSQLITPPVTNGSGPVYETLGFVVGTGGKPNMINVRIKN
jgi:hypothetical protein